MRTRVPPTVDDAIRFIEDRVPDEGRIFRKNPFVGRRFHYLLIEEALAKLHSEGRYLGLQPFDIRGTISLWNGPDGTNYPLARQATRRLISSLKARLPKVPLERLLPEITHRSFNGTPIDTYGTVLGGMLANVYGGSPYRALKDLVDHDQEFCSYRDFEPHDMRKAPQETWMTKEGKKDYPRARNLTRECVEAIRSKHPERSLDSILAKAEVWEFLSMPLNKYGTTIGGMIDQVYGRSIYLALRDLAEHDSRYRGYLPAIAGRRYRRPKGYRPEEVAVPRVRSARATGRA